MELTLQLGDVSDLPSLADALDRGAAYLVAVAAAVRGVPAPQPGEPQPATTATGRSATRVRVPNAP